MPEGRDKAQQQVRQNHCVLIIAGTILRRLSLIALSGESGLQQSASGTSATIDSSTPQAAFANKQPLGDAAAKLIARLP